MKYHTFIGLINSNLRISVINLWLRYNVEKQDRGIMETSNKSARKAVLIAVVSFLGVCVIATTACLCFQTSLWPALILPFIAALYFPWCYLSLHLEGQDKNLLYLVAGIIDIFFLSFILVLFAVQNRSATYILWPTAVMAVVTIIVTVYSGYDILKGNNLHWLVRTIPYSLTGCVLMFVLIQLPNTASAFEENSGAQWFFTGLFTFLTFDYIKQVIDERICPKTPAAVIQESVPMKHS